MTDEDRWGTLKGRSRQVHLALGAPKLFEPASCAEIKRNSANANAITASTKRHCSTIFRRSCMVAGVQTD